MSSDLAAAGSKEPWLHDLAAAADPVDDDVFISELPRIVKCLTDDLGTMARPVLETTAPDDQAHARTVHWQTWLAALPADRLSEQQIEALFQGHRGGTDSLHLLVMDLHKQINHLQTELASEVIDGAHVWLLQSADHVLVATFMRGLNRTAPVKFDHPGPDTAATRDGERLLIQNDIGTNDAHVLVIQVVARSARGQSSAVLRVEDVKAAANSGSLLLLD